MGAASFEILARNGIRRLSKDQIRDLAVQARASAVDTGDARFCFLSQTLARIAEHFEQAGAIEPDLEAAINQVLRIELKPALSEADPEAGSAAAARLEERVRDVLMRSRL